MTVTPEALRAALDAHGSAAAAYRSLPITRQGVHDRAELRAVVAAWRAERRAPGAEVALSLAPAVARRLRAAAVASAKRRGGSRPDVSQVARGMVLAALRRSLPAPLGAPHGGERAHLVLGDAWTRLQASAGPGEAIGVLRAILGRATARKKRLDGFGDRH